MGALARLVGGAFVLGLLSAETLDAFAVGSAVRKIDIDTTIPLTTETFWRLAHSQDFYRSTRKQTGTVRQEVVNLSSWVPVDDDASSEAQPHPPAAGAAGTPGSVRLGGGLRRPIIGLNRQLEQDHGQGQDQQAPGSDGPRSWFRKVELTYAISSPFGSSDATVVQEQRLLDQQPDGSGICYSEKDCIRGFPMVPGNLSVVTTFLVTPAEDGDPERVRVRVGVVVEEVELPRRFQFLNKRVGKIVGNQGRKQAEMWLGEMIKAAPKMTQGA